MHSKRQYLFGVLALLGAVFLFVGGPGPDSLRSFRYVWGMGHIFCFALWAYLYVNWRPHLSFKRHLVEVLLLALVLGGLSELIQSQIGREATWQDLGNDLVGALGCVVFCAGSRKSMTFWRLKCLQVPIIILILWNFLPVGKVLIDDVVSWKQFPLLSGFETPLEKSRWSGGSQRKINHDIFYSGHASLQITLNTQRYSGIGLKDFPRDWSSYKSVSLQIFNPDTDPLKIHFRIHDRHHYDNKNAYSDRFNTSFDLSPGWNHLEIPLEKVAQAPKTRSMDMGHISGMGLFVAKLDHPRTIYLDDVMLHP